MMPLLDFAGQGANRIQYFLPAAVTERKGQNHVFSVGCLVKGIQQYLSVAAGSFSVRPMTFKRMPFSFIVFQFAFQETPKEFHECVYFVGGPFPVFF
jgi:hypothetical protein